MAKIRTLDPQWVERLALMGLSRDARLLYWEASSLADDEGLLLWSPAIIAETLAGTDGDSVEQVGEWMRELGERNLVLPYKGGRQQLACGWVVHFHAHQRIKRRSRSTLPPPSLQNQAVQDAYHARDGYLCHLCQRREPGPGWWCNDELAPSLDHLTPLSAGGSDYPSNIASSHRICNLSRGDAPLQQARTLAQTSPAWARRYDMNPATNPLTAWPGHATDHPRPVLLEAIRIATGTDVSHPRSTRSLTLPDSGGTTLPDSGGTTLPDSGGTTLPEQSTTTPGGTVKPLLTCENGENPDDLTPTPGTLRSTTGVPLEGYAGDRDRERELEGIGDPLSASRSCTAGGGATSGAEPSDSPALSSAFGAGNEETDKGSLHLVAAPVLTEPTAPAQSPGSTSLDGRAGMPDLSGADGVLTTRPSAATTTGRDDSVIADESQDSLFVVPAEMLKEPEQKKRKRAEPATWTTDRKELAHSLLKPWWAIYGDGWTQSYGVVFGVLIAALSNKVSPEDIQRALSILGPERKPISGGTIGFALSRTTKQAAEEKAFEAAASSRSAAKYTRLEM